MFHDVSHYWIQGNVPCLEAHWEHGGEKLLLQTFAYGMFYFLQAKTKTPMECFETFLLIGEMLSFERIQWKKKQTKVKLCKNAYAGRRQKFKILPPNAMALLLTSLVLT